MALLVAINHDFDFFLDHGWWTKSYGKKSRYSNRTVIYYNRTVKSSQCYTTTAVLIRLGMLLLTLILVEWLELVAMTFFNAVKCLANILLCQHIAAEQ